VPEGAGQDQAEVKGRSFNLSKEATVLVLSRKKEEQIVIGDLVTITVVQIRGDKVRIGIEAPAEVTIHRREVYDAIRAEEERRRKEQQGENPC
jgi:carbon storage regulator